jgi:hypothetical protein
MTKIDKKNVMLAELKKIDVLGDDPVDSLESLPGNQYHQLTYRLARKTGFSYDEITGLLDELREEHETKESKETEE